MKMMKLKLVAGFMVTALAGLAVYAVAQSVSAKAAQDKLKLESAIDVFKVDYGSPGKKDAIRNVVFIGKIRYEDGSPAANVQIGAQAQTKAILAQFDARRKQIGISNEQSVQIQTTKKDQEESWNNAVSKLDGSYEMPVGANIPYNVMVFDETGKWVAAAIEGVSGAQNTSVQVPDLILTRGSLVTGTVTDSNGKPAAGESVMSYGPHRPESSAGVLGTLTNSVGKYILRVAPGKSRIYTVNADNTTMNSQNLNIGAGQIVTVDFQVK